MSYREQLPDDQADWLVAPATDWLVSRLVEENEADWEIHCVVHSGGVVERWVVARPGTLAALEVAFDTF